MQPIRFVLQFAQNILYKFNERLLNLNGEFKKSNEDGFKPEPIITEMLSSYLMETLGQYKY
jgi:hypothetical protein